MPTKAVLITVAHGVAGWALCGATMGVGMATTSLENALVIHAAAAPVIFSALSVVYFRYFGYWRPLKAAAVFVAVVITLDFFVVALLVYGDLAMFRSLVGTWLPFLLIFLSAWFAGRYASRYRVTAS